MILLLRSSGAVLINSRRYHVFSLQHSSQSIAREHQSHSDGGALTGSWRWFAEQSCVIVEPIKHPKQRVCQSTCVRVEDAPMENDNQARTPADAQVSIQRDTAVYQR